MIDKFFYGVFSRKFDKLSEFFVPIHALRTQKRNFFTWALHKVKNKNNEIYDLFPHIATHSKKPAT
jgi:hypothetical protein